MDKSLDGAAEQDMEQLKVIAHIHTDFPEKFGVPRQSGLVPGLKGTICFEPEFAREVAVMGLEEFSWIWLLWGFEGTERNTWSPTVRPPRLGGNVRKGVFATRSPFRPNPIGLSSVKLERIEMTDQGPVLHVAGIDMKDGTPIYDIKPYLAYVDSHPEAGDGFAAAVRENSLQVNCPEELLDHIPADKRNALLECLRQDPRPHYHEDPERVYGVAFDQFDVKFRVAGQELIVIDVKK